MFDNWIKKYGDAVDPLDTNAVADMLVGKDKEEIVEIIDLLIDAITEYGFYT